MPDKVNHSNGRQQSYKLLDDQDRLVAELPLLHPTLGFDVIDIRKLYPTANITTLDPSYGSTASCESSISYVDGDNGILLYRGYTIEELAERSTFLEVAYLLLFGELPTQSELDTFVHDVTMHTMVHEQIANFYSGFRRDAHPMAVLLGVVGALSAFYPDSVDIHDPQQRMISIYRLIAKMPTISAMAHKYTLGQPFVYPKNDIDYSANFLNMMFSVPAEKYKVNPIFAKAMNALFLVQADHEQNASTSTVRVVGSSHANPFATIAAGIASLWGPLHGGANEAVLRMLLEIGSKDRIPEIIRRAKDKTDPFRLSGFGHRVYKSYDPRAKVMSKIYEEVLSELNVKNDPLFDLARELERVALEDEYFVSHKLYPNVDFYSGVIMRALGIPMTMFTAIFAIGRTPGWLAQWKEMIEDPDLRISRPRQLYTGAARRSYVDVTHRVSANGLGAAKPVKAAVLDG